MSLTDLFKLAKLTITGYSDPKYGQQIGLPIEVQYNPETLSVRHESVFTSKPGIGGTSAGEWTHSPPQRLNVSLIIDGTGADVMGVQLREVLTVAAQIDRFLAITGYVQGSTHEPAYVKLQWSKGVLDAEGFKCRLESVDVNYKAFDRDGSPLSAELVAVFVKTLTPRQEQQAIKRTSPDLTHRRVVVAGDTLPLLCDEIYGSPLHYLRVAQVNALDDFRNLVAGTELFFPPFQRPKRK